MLYTPTICWFHYKFSHIEIIFLINFFIFWNKITTSLLLFWKFSLPDQLSYFYSCFSTNCQIACFHVSKLTCKVHRGASILLISSAWRCSLAEEGVNAVRVTTESSQCQSCPPHLVPLVYLSLPLQQHLQGLSMAMVRLKREITV